MSVQNKCQPIWSSRLVGYRQHIYINVLFYCINIFFVQYGEYKLEFRRQKINEFFVSHKTQEWFRLKYQPQELQKATKKAQKAIRRRCEIFQELSDKGFLEGVSCDDGKEMEIIKLLDSVVILLEVGIFY